MKNARKLIRSVVGTLLIVLAATGCERDCAVSHYCELEPESGPCFSYNIRYYYDADSRQCKSFVWGGCEGVVPFETMDQCRECLCHE